MFIKDDKGEYQVVNCSTFPVPNWHTVNNWEKGSKEEQIVVFVYQSKALADTFIFKLAFTTKENFANRFNENFDFSKICKIKEDFETFLQVKEYLVKTFNYKEENIFEESNNKNRKYKLGLFNI